MRKIKKLVLPGKVLKRLKTLRNIVLVGPGLRKNGEGKVCVTKPGILRFKKPNVYWVDSVYAKYIPHRGDFVVGIVQSKSCNAYTVDIGYHETAQLAECALEGATSKLKTVLEVGDCVYARILNAPKVMTPELVCVNNMLQARNLGPLGNGFLFNMPTQFALKILHQDNEIIHKLWKRARLEIAIGANGGNWLRAIASGNEIAVRKKCTRRVRKVSIFTLTNPRQ